MAKSTGIDPMASGATVAAPVEILRDPDKAISALKPPRPTILAALRQPDSASGLAGRLELPRQRVNHHLRDLEDAGLVVLVEQRRRRGCTERVMMATAQRYLLSPELLGALPDKDPEDVLDHDPFGWPSLAVLAGRTIQDLAVLSQHLDDAVPALSLPAQVRFSSPSLFQEFFQELNQEIGRLLTKYHDESAPSALHWFLLGAYPVVPPVDP